MHPSIEQLLSVQEVDSEMIIIRESLRRRPLELEDERRKVAEARRALEALLAQIKRVRLESEQRELEVKRMDAEIEKLQVVLNQAKTNQEYTIVREQIKRQGEMRGQAEEDVLQKLSDLDAMDVERKALAARLETEEKACRRKENEVQALVAEMEKELHGLEQKRQGLLDGINHEHLTVYGRVLARHNNFAIARVESQVCQGCYISVTSQEVNLLMQDQFLQCKSCSRLLYLA